jgi:hypothetical protein
MNVQRQVQAKPNAGSSAGLVLQRKCACGQHTIAGGECEECKRKREGQSKEMALPKDFEEAQTPDAEQQHMTRFANDFSQVPANADGAQVRPGRTSTPTTSGSSGTATSGTPTGNPLLHDCATWPSASNLSGVLTLAQTAASRAVQGLQSVLGHWGMPSTTATDKATEMGLRKGFNMEPDKSGWSIIGIPQAEIRSADRRDRTVTQTILTNLRQIADDAPHFQSAPACTHRLSSGSPCVGCVDAAHSRCQHGATAYVRHESIGQPSSPIFFCPTFFTNSTEEMAEIFLHEVAHLQPFGASDYVRGTRYYGCPVGPVNDFNESDSTLPGLLDPNDFLTVADSYRCFLQTQREHQVLYQQLEQTDRRIKQETHDFLEPRGNRP